MAGFGVFMGSSAQAAGSAQHSKEDVTTFAGNGLYETEETVGFSNLVRKNDEIMIQVKTSDLIPGGVYTYWWLADENLDDTNRYDLIIWADYVIVGSNGKSNVNLKLETGEVGIADNPTVYVDTGDPGLNSPFDATVEVQIVYHGQEEFLPDDPELRDEWFTTFWVGDDAVCTVNIGDPEIDPTCPLAQRTVHEP